MQITGKLFEAFLYFYNLPDEAENAAEVEYNFCEMIAGRRSSMFDQPAGPFTYFRTLVASAYSLSAEENRAAFLAAYPDFSGLVSEVWEALPMAAPRRPEVLTIEDGRGNVLNLSFETGGFQGAQMVFPILTDKLSANFETFEAKALWRLAMAKHPTVSKAVYRVFHYSSAENRIAEFTDVRLFRPLAGELEYFLRDTTAAFFSYLTEKGLYNGQ